MEEFCYENVIPRPVFGNIRAAAQSAANRRVSMRLMADLIFSGIRNQNFSKSGDRKQIQRAPAIPMPRAENRQI